VVVCRPFEMAALDHNNTSQHDAMRCDAVAGVISFLGRYSKSVAGCTSPFAPNYFLS